MKVSYEVKQELDIKEVKNLLKPYGGRCAKIDGNQLVYQIKEENEDQAKEELRNKGYIE